MTIVWGAVLAAGILLTASPWLWPAGTRKPQVAPAGRTVRLLESAGMSRMPVGGVFAAAAACAAVLAAAGWLLTQVAPLALVAAVVGALVPFAWLRMRRSQLLRTRRGLWPDVCDLLIASVRAGMSLPDAVASLADSAPAPLRPPFAAFARDIAASGHFDSSAIRLKSALADPVADRIVETLRMARQVGGTELTPVLRALAASVRADAALRSEVESRQSWIRGAAVLGVVAPWAILALLAMRPEGARAYGSPEGVVLILAGAAVSFVAYRVMLQNRTTSRAEAVVRVTGTMTTQIAYAVVLGGSFGLGVCLLVSLVPRWGAPSLARRIAPYIRDITDPQGVTPTLAPGRADIGEWWRSLQLRMGRMAGSSVSVDRRLRQAAWPMDAAAFRGRQLAWAIAGVAFGGVVLVAMVLTSRASGAVVVLPPLCGVIAAVLYDARLSHAARTRVGRIEDELPTVLEFLALCLSAGEGILDSLRRVSEVGVGELTGELRGVVLAVSTGSPLSESLGKMSHRLEIASLSRTVDQVVAAIDRGAPLAHVLHSQALDAREDAKRGLIERAGRKEIYMLIPLVFLILPLSVLFAVFPGIFMLRLGIG